MNIFGAKKKQVDTSKIEKKVKDMDNLYKYNFFEMYNNFKNINFKFLEIENSIKEIKNKPDRKIISLVAGYSGPAHEGKNFIFSGGVKNFVMNFPGQILGLSLLSIKSNSKNIQVSTLINGYEKIGYGMDLSNPYDFVNFKKPLQFDAGNLIGFRFKNTNEGSLDTQLTAVVELFL